MHCSGKIKIKTRRAIYQSGNDVGHPPTSIFKALTEETVRALNILLIACESDDDKLRKCCKHIIDRILSVDAHCLS